MLLIKTRIEKYIDDTKRIKMNLFILDFFPFQSELNARVNLGKAEVRNIDVMDLVCTQFSE